MVADNNLAFRALESKSFKRFIRFVSPLAVRELPGRDEIGGAILTNYATALQVASESDIRRSAKQTGGKLNFLSDGWENVTKTHVLGVVLTLFGKTFVYGAYKTGARHDGLAIASVLLAYINILTTNVSMCSTLRVSCAT